MFLCILAASDTWLETTVTAEQIILSLVQY